MKLIERAEVMALGDYEVVRERFRARVIADKKARRVHLGEHMSAIFENRDTVLLQIQEMLRTERITKESGIEHEMKTYNELIPGDDELSMTLFIEVNDKSKRDALLEGCAGMEKHVFIEIDGQRISAVAADRDGAMESRTTAVQYYKIPLGGSAARLKAAEPLKAGSPKVAVLVEHAGYNARVELDAASVSQLRGDLTWS